VTRRQLDRAPTGPGLLTDLRETDYDALLMLFNEICTKIYMEWLSITVKL
jgi:hypothetical protein